MTAAGCGAAHVAVVLRFSGMTVARPRRHDPCRGRDQQVSAPDRAARQDISGHAREFRDLGPALVALAAAVLFFCYWRQSRSAPLTSDGSGNVLQAWDMLHGNLLLHNWWVSDVSFYTTELPQYMLVEVLTGLGPGWCTRPRP